jgi:hypothetical protein
MGGGGGYMKAWFIDGETSVKNRGDSAIGDMKASPYCADNKMVMFGERQGGCNYIWNMPKPFPLIPHCLMAARKEKVLLIGHNISFDLKYLKKTYAALWDNVINNIYIWDTQQVAYLLSGQTHMYPSLDELTLEVGGELKDEKIKEYWENGVDTEDIPVKELSDYLQGDLENTEKVFRYQYEIVKELPKLFNLVKVKMDDILATTMMEENGMEFDLVAAKDWGDKLEFAIALSGWGARTCVKGMFEEDFEFNPMSNDHVSLAMFGGSYKLRRAMPVKDEHGNEVVYKTGARKGRVKTRMEDVTFTAKGYGCVPPPGESPNAKGIYSVADEVLARYAGSPLAIHVKSIRENTKQLETYCRGYSKLVWPDNKIHASFGHCGTRTGRNNHSKPNLGNVTREE